MNQKKAELVVAVSDEQVKRGYHAGNIARKIANEIGGSGGGRPQLAQAGGKAIDRIDAILNDLEKYIVKE
jgi:alanyl-tRNA synthetase